ncbi:Hypothetical predicted protein [Mytilus galloprovincialis]|uniref:Uncharacterized protein n=1 Tax=Mytilus galloprovincialis TaxID=29158 RepID=A0A8B6H2U4_MYTGA|nr:Hypothetical predicted protein [Mytilus galloprovincialis]
MAYILLDKDGGIPGHSKEAMTPRNTPRDTNVRQHDPEFFTKLDEQNIQRIDDRESRRKEDAKWMIYDKRGDDRAMPVSRQNNIGYTQEDMAQNSPRDHEFYTKLDEESVTRIRDRENKRQEAAKWMVYDKVAYDKAVPVIGKSPRRGQDYVPHPIEKPYVRQAEQYKRPEGNMDGMTSYKKEYTEKHPERVHAIKHDGQRLPGGRFEGEPTYRADYKKWETSRQEPYGLRDSYQAPTQPFGGESTMHHDFRKYNQAKREPLRPMEAAIGSDQPFADMTDYRAEYKKHALPAKHLHQQEGYKPSSAPLDDLTTFRRDYKGQHGQPTRSFKPDNAAFSSGQPLEDTTTNRKDYIKWPMDRPYVHQHDAYQKPEGEMYTQTTHNATYKQLPLTKNLAMRPTSAGKARNAPFDGTTNYTQDYKKWALQKNQPHQRDEYQPNNAPFEGMPTYKAHYVPHGVHPTQSFRPDNTAFQSNARFEDGTMYRTDYTKKQMPLCPCHDPQLPANRVIMCERHNVPVMSTIQKLPMSARTPMAVA